MRTTIDLPEELFREVKLRAVQQGKTLKELVSECIRSGLQQPSESIGDRDRQFRIIAICEKRG